MKNSIKILSLFLTLSIFIVACDKDEDTDLCEDVVCQNGGECVDGTCDCPEGFSGEFCQNEETETPEGFSPSYNETDCIVQGEPYSAVVVVKNYETIVFSGQTIQVESLIIDSLGNLPDGITYDIDKANNTFLPGEQGEITFSGTSNAAVGDYEVDVWVNVLVNVDGSQLELQNKVSTIINNFGVTGFDLEYYLRVRAPGAACDDVVE